MLLFSSALGTVVAAFVALFVVYAVVAVVAVVAVPAVLPSFDFDVSAYSFLVIDSTL